MGQNYIGRPLDPYQWRYGSLSSTVSSSRHLFVLLRVNNIIFKEELTQRLVCSRGIVAITEHYTG